ncbi:MAG: diguanylate cyclase, partial [Desulfobacterales bacterium]|nr:diguanylate cyclase [Desulfobacterales bacterium]
MANLKQTISPRVLEDLKKRSLAGVFTYTIALCVVLFPDGYYFRYPRISNWFLWLITGICVLRLIQLFIESKFMSRPTRVNIGFFWMGVVVTGLIWGVLSAMVMVQTGEANVKLMMLVCTIGICSGGCSAFSPDLRLAVAFNFSILWPNIFALTFVVDNIPLVILLVMFSTYMAFMSNRQNTEYWTALNNEALLEEKSRDLEKLSNMDGLTGLYNRRFFDTAFELAWERALRKRQRLSLIICDIDYFKQVNDTHGHQAGDEFLRTMADTLTQVFKRRTDIVARYGGEEFVVLIEEAGDGWARDLSERFRQQAIG